jgi:hypothetical protein
LGFNCAHAYAHTNDRYTVRLPFALKGVDVVVYTVFRALGLHVNIQPVLERIEDGDSGRDPDEEDDEDSWRDSDQKSEGELVGTGLHGMLITEEGGSDGYGDKKEVWRHTLSLFHLTKPTDSMIDC